MPISDKSKDNTSAGHQAAGNAGLDSAGGGCAGTDSAGNDYAGVDGTGADSAVPRHSKCHDVTHKSGQAEVPRLSLGKWVGVAVFLITFLADRVAKVATDVFDVRGQYGWIRWTHLHNYGAAAGILRGDRLLLITVGALVMLSLIWVWWNWKTRNVLLWFGWGLLFGGALGNETDRVVYGYVIDMFQWPGQRYVFNLSDVAIRYGVILFLLSWWIGEWMNQRRTQRAIRGRDKSRRKP